MVETQPPGFDRDLTSGGPSGPETPRTSEQLNQRSEFRQAVDKIQELEDKYGLDGLLLGTPEYINQMQSLSPEDNESLQNSYAIRDEVLNTATSLGQLRNSDQELNGIYLQVRQLVDQGRLNEAYMLIEGRRKQGPLVRETSVRARRARLAGGNAILEAQDYAYQRGLDRIEVDVDRPANAPIAQSKEVWEWSLEDAQTILDAEIKKQQDLLEQQRKANSRERGFGWSTDSLGGYNFEEPPAEITSKEDVLQYMRKAVEDAIRTVENKYNRKVDLQQLSGEVGKVVEGLNIAETNFSLLNRGELDNLKFYVEGRLYVFAAEKLLDDDNGNLESYLNAMGIFAQEFEKHMNALYTSGDGKVALAAEFIEKPDTMGNIFIEVNGQQVSAKNYFRPELDIGFDTYIYERAEYKSKFKDKIIKKLITLRLAEGATLSFGNNQTIVVNPENLRNIAAIKKVPIPGQAQPHELNLVELFQQNQSVDLSDIDDWDLEKMKEDSDVTKEVKALISEAEDAFNVSERLLIATGTASRQQGALIKVEQRDPTGSIVYKLDQAGNKIPLRDANGREIKDARGDTLYQPEREWRLLWDEVRDRFRAEIENKWPTQPQPTAQPVANFYWGLADPVTRESVFGKGVSEEQAWGYIETSRNTYNNILWQLKKEYYGKEENNEKIYIRPRGFKWIKGIYDLTGHIDNERIPYFEVEESLKNGVVSRTYKFKQNESKPEIIMVEMLPDVDLFVRYLNDYLNAETLRDVVAGINDVSPQLLARRGSRIKKKEIIEYYTSMLPGAAVQKAKIMGGNIGKDQSTPGFLVIPMNDPEAALTAGGLLFKNGSIIDEIKYNQEIYKYRKVLIDMLAPLLQVRDGFTYLNGPRSAIASSDNSKKQILKAFKEYIDECAKSFRSDEKKGGGNLVQWLHFPISAVSHYLNMSNYLSQKAYLYQDATEYEEIIDVK